MAKRKVSAREERRMRERAAQKLADNKERLARLEPGGNPESPVAVQSASQVEPHALALPCLRCDGTNRLEEHAAVTQDGTRLRLARLVCPRCGARRDVWFRIDDPRVQLN